VVWADDARLLRLFVARMEGVGDFAPFAHAEWFTGGEGQRQSQVYVGDGPVQLRVRRTGGTLHLSFSANGRVWRDAAPPVTDLPLGPKLRVGVAAVNASPHELVAALTGYSVEPSRAGSDTPTTDDKARLQGRWRIVGAERNGKPVPIAELKKMDWIEFNGDKETMYWNNQKWSGAYTLNPAAEPREMDFAFPPFRIIYRFDGDGLIMAQCGPIKPRPASFNSSTDPTVTVATYARAEKPPAAVAPFDAAKAKEHQEAWSDYLGVPVEFTNTVGIIFRLIPPGEFDMGNSDENPFALPEDKPQHRVRVTKPFLLGTHEVTVGQFREFVMATNAKTFAETDPRGAQVADVTGYHSKPGTNWRTPGFPQADDHPVTCVTWAEAAAYCEWLSKKEGVTYRLPTDAEWEYACRGGTTTAYHYGPKADTAMAAMQRWEEEKKTLPVGSFPANPFGLKDMLGNVYEWCLDGRRKYAPGSVTDPLGPTGPADVRVRRGGAWSSGLDQKAGAQSGGRSVGPPNTDAAHTIGFRVALVGDLTKKPKPPDTGVVQALRDAVAAKERLRDMAKVLVEAGKAAKMELVAAEIDLIEARVQLARAEKNQAAVIEQLEGLVAQRESERDLIERVVQAGSVAPGELKQADARLAEAKVRLAQAKSE
jgi:uncharacterized protein (TIGR03067 family)